MATSITRLLSRDIDDDDADVLVDELDRTEARAGLVARLDAADYSPAFADRIERLLVRVGVAGIARDLVRVANAHERSPLSRTIAARVLLRTGVVRDPTLLEEALLASALLWDDPDPVELIAALLERNPASFERLERLRTLCGASGAVYASVRDPGLRRRIERRLGAEGDIGGKGRPRVAGEPVPRFRAFAAAPRYGRMEVAIALDGPGDTLSVRSACLSVDGLDAGRSHPFVLRRLLVDALGEFERWTPAPYEEVVWLLLEAAGRRVRRLDVAAPLLRWASWGAPSARRPGLPEATSIPTEQEIDEWMEDGVLVHHYAEAEGLPRGADLDSPDVRREIAAKLTSDAVATTRWMAHHVAVWYGWRRDAGRGGAARALLDDVDTNARNARLVDLYLRWDGRTAAPWDRAELRPHGRSAWTDLARHYGGRPATARTLAEADMADAITSALEDPWPIVAHVPDPAAVAARIAEKVGDWYEIAARSGPPAALPGSLAEEVESILVDVGQDPGDAKLLATEVVEHASWRIRACAGCPEACWRDLDADKSAALAADRAPITRAKGD